MSCQYCAKLHLLCTQTIDFKNMTEEKSMKCFLVTKYSMLGSERCIYKLYE